MSNIYFKYIVSIIVIVLLISACNSETTNYSNTRISVLDTKNLIADNKKVTILDVRTPKEFSRGHIAGAININIHDPNFSKYAATLDKDKLYIVHCAVNPRGGRGDKSIHIMDELGFSNLLSMDGGINAWKRAGLPISNS